MKNSISPGLKAKQAAYYSVSLACCFALYAGHVNAVDDVLAITNAGATTNRFNVGNAINTICPRGGLGAELQARCNALVGARPVANPRGSNITDRQLTGILGQVTSEQTAAENTQALEMNNPQLANISNRMSAFRTGKKELGLNVSNLMFDRNGNPIATHQLAKLDSAFNFNKAAAGDEVFSRLSVFANGNIGFGDRVITANEAGYNLDTHGATVGADYRITDNFLLGTAFSYQNTRTGYLNNLGKMDADSYTGAIYASFYTESGFFVDGIFSGSHVDYASTRHIEYTVPEVINTNAQGVNQGDEFNVAMTPGYNLSFGGLTVTPQVRVDYTTTQVDSLDERGARGWALHIDQQQFESLQTAPGLQLAYALSLPWAVIIPTARAEYIHEFKNDSRNIRSYYIQDANQTRFNIRTDNPDRDYIVVSAGMSAQFAHGISAFVNYDTVQAHSYVNNHNFTGGVRVDLSF